MTRLQWSSIDAVDWSRMGAVDRLGSANSEGMPGKLRVKSKPGTSEALRSRLVECESGANLRKNNLSIRLYIQYFLVGPEVAQELLWKDICRTANKINSVASGHKVILGRLTTRLTAAGEQRRCTRHARRRLSEI